MKALVTGAAGFVGSHTVDQLLAEGHEVVGIDNLRTGALGNLAPALLSPRFRFVQADALETSNLDDLLETERPDSIIHLAGLVNIQESVAKPDLNFALNVELTHRLAEAMRRNRVNHLVFASSAAVYGHAAELPVTENSSTVPINPYGCAKLASETLLLGYAQAYGISVWRLRYFNIYGTRQDPSSPYSGVISIFARHCAAGLPVTIYGDGSQTRDFIHVSDVAKANVRAAGRKNSEGASALNICTGASVSLNRLLEIIRSKVPATPPPIYAPPRATDILHSSADPAPARAWLDFAATTRLEDGIQTLLEKNREALQCF